MIYKQLTLDFSRLVESKSKNEDLNGRFRQLSHNRSPRSVSTPLLLTEVSNKDGEACPPSPTIEELLAELNTEEEHYRIDHNDLAEAENLILEAKRALPLQRDTSAEATPEWEAKGEKWCNCARLSPQGVSEGEKAEVDERTEAALSLQHILDEVAIEKEHSPLGNDNDRTLIEKSPEVATEVDQGGHDMGEVIPLLPSAPTHAPPPKAPADAILLPSAPTAAPKLSASKKGSKFTDAEIKTWCIICVADATIRCLGCAGDLYCNLCWKEGHTGPDAGYEEQKHKAVALRRNKVGSM